MPTQGNASARAAFLLLVVTGLTAAVPRPAPEQICAAIARQVEREQGIPSGLVQAVALAETGRWDPGARQSYAWPWTVTSKRDTYYLPDKSRALAKVQELQAMGRRNIDVGCMQINLMWHGEAFDSVADALEPQANVRYGAGFLSRLRLDTRSWSLATARYHSSNPARGNAYRAKVYRLWERVREEPSTVRASAPAGTTEPMPAMPVAGRVGAPAMGGWRARIRPDGTRPASPGAIAILRGW
jgi:hypothetical protein